MKNFAKFCAVSLLSLAVSSAAFASGEDNALTLVDAVSKGILKNPEYGVVANNNLATKTELEQGKALYRPSIDLRAETGSEHTDTTFVSGNTLWHNRASLTLTQMLFDGWAARSEVERQEARVRSSAYRVGEVAEFVGLDIVQAYLEVMRQRDLLTLARANIEDHTTILNTIKTGANAGTVTAGDVAQANARLAQARATAAATEQDLRSAEALFIQKVGDVPGEMVFPYIPRDQLPSIVEDAVRLAVTNSPTLNVFESDIKVAAAEYKAAGSTLYPKVNLELNGTTANNVSGIEGHDNRASAMAVVAWNLYRGGADIERQREYAYRHAETKERRAQAARQVEKDVRDTWAGMEASATKAKEFQDQANANEKVVSVYLDQFSLDRRTLLDVLDAQNELFVSRSSHVNALYTEEFAVFRVLALEGKMLDNLGIPKPRESSIEN